MLREKWELIPRDTDVLVTHSPPHGIGDGSGVEGDGYGGPDRLGCVELRSRVLAIRPMLHLFGHIHDSGGAWRISDTAFANVTTWECERGPTVIDIDLGLRQVRLIDVPPVRG